MASCKAWRVRGSPSFSGVAASRCSASSGGTPGNSISVTGTPRYRVTVPNCGGGSAPGWVGDGDAWAQLVNEDTTIMAKTRAAQVSRNPSSQNSNYPQTHLVLSA